MTDSGCGCLTLLLGIISFLFFIKFGFVILLFIIILLVLSNKYNLNKAVFKDNKEFVSKPGVVYKECSFCHSKAERTAKYCSNCGKPFESGL